jgi:DNA-binding MarR family transcriptional regulator
VAIVAEEAGNTTGETFGRLSGPGAGVRELYAALSELADRDVQREHIELIVRRAGETLSPLAAWMLVRIESTRYEDVLALANTRGVSHDRVESAIAELRDRGLIRSAESIGASEPSSMLTDAGCDVLERIIAARRAHFEELSADWDPEHDQDAATYLRNVVNELVPAIHRPANLVATSKQGA